MTLVDTSIWVDHFRKGEPGLVRLLENAEVVMHDFILGELACGNLQRRSEILEHLRALPSIDRLDEDEAHAFVLERKLYGRGIGWIDVHLLGAAVLAGCALWTRDKRLRNAANAAGVGTIV